MIELTFLKELVLIRQVSKKSVIFAIGIFLIKGLVFNQMSEMAVMTINDVYEP